MRRNHLIDKAVDVLKSYQEAESNKVKVGAYINRLEEEENFSFECCYASDYLGGSAIISWIEFPYQICGKIYAFFLDYFEGIPNNYEEVLQWAKEVEGEACKVRNFFGESFMGKKV